MSDLANSPVLQEIIDNFAYLDEWEDRYRYLIELGKTLKPLAPESYNDANKVRGCASQVWLETRIVAGAKSECVLDLHGDSDAHIVKGLVALILALFSGQSASEILKIDANAVFGRLGLAEHLTPQRSNGTRAMVERIRQEAMSALAQTAS